MALAGCGGESAESLLASARKHLEKNDNRAAVIQLKNLLQKDSDHAEGRFLLGKALLDGGDIVGAEVELQKAKELGYDSDRVTPLLARIALAKGETQKIISNYGGLSLKSPEAEVELQVVLAWAYLAQNKPAQAQKAVEAALTAAPQHVGARLLEVRMLAGRKGVADALAALEQVIASAPQDADARQLKGELLLVSGREDAALAAFREAIQLRPTFAAAHTSALWLLLGRKDLPAAEAQLELLRKAAPQSPQTKFFTAAVAFEKGDLRSALEQVQRLLQQLPDDVMALQLAGAIELSKGLLLQAEAHLGKAMQLAPAQPRVRLLLAQVHLRSGEPGKVAKVLQPLLEADPPQWEPQVLMAQSYVLGGDTAKAERYFERAAALNPRDAASRTALALAQVAKGKTEQGIEALRSISSTDTGVAADLALINAHLRRKEFDNAIKAIERLEAKQPKSPLAADLRGRAELQRGNPDRAREAFLAALAINPSFFPAVASLASMEVAQGKTEAAQQRFEAFFKANPTDVRAGLALARMRSQTGAAPESVIDVLARTVKANPAEVAPRHALVAAYGERKDFKAGLTVAQEGLALLPDNPELLDALGQTQYLAGDVNQAVATYNRIVSLQPTSPLPLMRLSDIYRAQKDLPGATAALRKALEVMPDFVPARQALMTLELTAGRRKEALAMARVVQRQPGNEAAGFALEGDLELSGKNWPAAANAYRQSLAKRASVDVAIKLHRVLVMGGQSDAAAKLAQQWMSSAAAAPAFTFYLGDAALNKGQYELAQQRFAEVLQLQPGNTAALNNLAWLLGRENKPEALELAQKAVKLAPREPSYMDTLAELHARKQDFAKAVQIQSAVVAMAPEAPAFRLRLASYYLGNNDKAKARVELDRLAALGDKFSGQAEVKALQAKL